MFLPLALQYFVLSSSYPKVTNKVRRSKAAKGNVLVSSSLKKAADWSVSMDIKSVYLVHKCPECLGPALC